MFPKRNDEDIVPFPTAPLISSVSTVPITNKPNNNDIISQICNNSQTNQI